MKTLLFISSGLLLIALVNLPIGYYTLLRIIITIASIGIILVEIKNGINFWTIAFGLIAVLFNPLIPIYLNDKEIWKIIDIICAFIFIIKGLIIKRKS